MLTAAALGMAFYGLYSAGLGLVQLVTTSPLEWWASLWLIGGGAVLMLAAVFVRVSMPGRLALAVAGLLALQSISLHASLRLYGQVALEPKIARAAVGGVLVMLACLGWGTDRPSDGDPFTTDEHHHTP